MRPKNSGNQNDEKTVAIVTLVATPAVVKYRFMN